MKLEEKKGGHMTTIDKLLDQATVKPKEPKPSPTEGPFGAPFMGHDRFPGDKSPAGVLVPETAMGNNPYATDVFYGKKCSVTGCKEGPQFRIISIPDLVPEDFFQPAVNASDSLAAQIELAVQQARPGRIVDTGPEVYLCIRHNAEFSAARAKRIEAERKANEVPSHEVREVASWPDLDIEIIDATYFVARSSNGKEQKLMHFQLAELKSYMAGKQFMYEPLTPSKAKAVVDRARMADLAPKYVQISNKY